MEDNRKIRISCLGDSITFGLCASNPEKSYPSVLGALLGDGYTVKNFGKSGATVINDYEEVPDRYSPYVKSEEYKLAMASQPDTVILMLGMNDGNPTHHFNEQNGGEISEYYLSLYKNVLSGMISDIQRLNTSPKVYLVCTTEMTRTVSKIFSEDYVRNFLSNLEKLREIQREVANEKNIPIIDTKANMQDPSYYDDGCHLTDTGYAKLAECIYRSL